MRNGVGSVAWAFELLENGTESRIGFDLFGYARVHGVVAFDSDLVGRIIGEVEGNGRMTLRSRDSFEDFSNHI